MATKQLYYNLDLVSVGRVINSLDPVSAQDLSTKTYTDTKQPLSTKLTDISALSVTTNNFIIGNGTTWVVKTPSEIRTILGLVIGTDVQAYNANLTSWAAKTVPSGTVVGTSDSQTLSNKRFTSRLLTISSGTTIEVNADSYDMVYYNYTAAAGTLTISNPTGTPQEGDCLIYKLKTTNVQTLSFGSAFAGSQDITNPSTTTGATKTDKLLYIYDSVLAKWVMSGRVMGA